MINTTTLIATGGAPLPVALVREALTAAGAVVGEPRLLAADTAVDLPITDLAPEAVDRTVTTALGDRPVDAITQPLAPDDPVRRRRLLVADMDSTMVTGETLDDLADVAGIKAEIAQVTERAMRGELDFEDALRSRVARLKGLPLSAVEETWAALTFTPGAETLVRTMAAHGAHTILVSGGFDVFTTRVAARLGFHEQHANRLKVADGALTGEVYEPILGREAKLATLNAAVTRLGVGPEAAVAVGDGANDLAMITAAGLGVAFHAKPVVAETAGARVRHGDLTALLYAQGYHRDQFTAAD